EAADKIVMLVKDKELRAGMGQRAKKTVKEQFLLSRYLEQYLDLFNSFKTVFRLTNGVRVYE
ncbi:MAG: hypothetical protein PHN78_07885, partial [Dehalococcoidales bacterium]|nr:hypothetical protein [Dehalococcoidales bacterium]